jgi:hypothetical protein
MSEKYVSDKKMAPVKGPFFITSFCPPQASSRGGDDDGGDASLALASHLLRLRLTEAQMR